MLLDLPDQTLLRLFTFQLNVKVKEVVPISSGKWPSSLGNVIAIDSDFGRDIIIDNVLRIARDIGEK